MFWFSEYIKCKNKHTRSLSVSHTHNTFSLIHTSVFPSCLTATHDLLHISCSAGVDIFQFHSGQPASICSGWVIRWSPTGVREPMGSESWHHIPLVITLALTAVSGPHIIFLAFPHHSLANLAHKHKCYFPVRVRLGQKWAATTPIATPTGERISTFEGQMKRKWSVCFPTLVFLAPSTLPFRLLLLL